MSTLFSGREFKHEKTFKEALEYKILKSGFQEHEFELIQGDVSKTASEFVQNKPGAKISLLYMDLDIEKPTYDVLKCLWDRVSSGGIVVFDEYAYHNWSESLGVDKFFKDKDVKINSMNFIAPSAYLIKP